MKISSFFSISHLALIALLCASCSHKKSAPIVNHSKSVYGKSNNVGKNKYSKNTSKKEEAPSVASNEIRVEAGDTLYSISNNPLERV